MRRGTGSILDGENEHKMSCRGPNLILSGALRSNTTRQQARYFRYFRREPENRRLNGGDSVGVRSANASMTASARSGEPIPRFFRSSFDSICVNPRRLDFHLIDASCEIANSSFSP